MKRLAERRPAAAGTDTELQEYRQAVEEVLSVLLRLQQGDLEARVPALRGPEPVQRLRDAFNDVIDVNDAFIREAVASLTAASHGEYYRRFLSRGLPGAYGEAADSINAAREHMSETAAAVARGTRKRLELADRVQEVAEQVAAASTELGASSDTLSTSARQAVDRVEGAVRTVQSLEASSAEIHKAVVLIKHIAAQTRLLALNATIEAARAADAGRGFAVVASEVKALADEVNRSSDDIASQVATAQGSAHNAAEVIHTIANVIAEMEQQVAGVAAAANGGTAGEAGLSQMAETLRGEIAKLADS
ncbi:methyl-accepting chemotaxis protein [Actinoplanes teichomyceticus]|uniref:Methyl-accepting chemotaxis protein (MCP) signaling protein n=1 Tax=Actinoplanes teichomyceticus TaxID=1867 RepID=A0A561WME5_ACTTI|nr:methyl-accepting chemotaxis protein [Actinoplanes teichomyceticus]TWG25047.1 methyl-accepting chemotaxis protein (MCP) signaling protein [Actinoplanes teichomyceticus]GIF10117.1 hypothetical protein Ate01nite_01490 [Actinoplanes teichomyceticus]